METTPKTEAGTPSSKEQHHPVPSSLSWRSHRPGTVTLLCTTLFATFIYSWFRKSHGVRHDVLTGLTMAVSIFCLYASLHFPDGTLVRPCKMFWRMIQALMLIYLMVLVFGLFLDVPTVKGAMGIIEPATLDYGEKSYAESCAIYDRSSAGDPWRNVKEKLDVFVLAHFFGWIVKALIIRDWVVLWVSSVLFEFLEQILKHILPNFAECWWDHLIMDAFGCNLLGIAAGMWMCNQLQLNYYRFGGPVTSSNERQLGWKQIFYPFNRELIDTSFGGWTTDTTSYKTLIALVFVVELFDLNYFFLKAILNIKPAHPMCAIRTFIVAASCASGISEVNEFCEDNRALKAHEEQLRLRPLSAKAVAYRISRLRHQKLGTNAWICLAVLVSEALLVIRWRSEGLAHWNITTPNRSFILGGLWTIIALICWVWARKNTRQRLAAKWEDN